MWMRWKEITSKLKPKPTPHNLIHLVEKLFENILEITKMKKLTKKF